MSIDSYRRIHPTALIALVTMWGCSLARADTNDYEFRLAEKQVQTGAGTIVVRLVHKLDGKPVPDAVILASRLDMAPEGMETMKAAIEAQASAEPGLYGFKVDLTMAGEWRLSLAAKIQGEAGTLESKLLLRATP